MFLKKLAVFAIPLVVVSCGNDKDSNRSSSPFGSKISSQFVDAPVKGMNVEGSISKKMVTGDNGKFSCVNGEELIFRLANVEIGRTNCNSWIHLFDLEPTVAHDAAASMIQSLATGTSVLDLTAFNKLPEAKNLATTDFGNDGDIKGFYDSIKTKLPGTTYIDSLAAENKAKSNLKDLSKDPIFDKLVALTEGDLEAGNGVPVKLKAASTNKDDECFENVQVMLKVVPTDMGNGKKAYQLKITEYKAYDGATTPAGCDDTSDYDCAENPLSKYITGRTISGSEFQRMSFSYKAGESIACYNGEYYVSEDTVKGSCEEGEASVKASKAQSFTFDFGMNYNIVISDKSIKLEYFERNSEFEPVIQNADEPSKAIVHLEPKSASSCRYSNTVEI